MVKFALLEFAPLEYVAQRLATLEPYYLWAGSAGLIFVGLVVLWRDRARDRRDSRRKARGPEHAAAVAHAIAERRRAMITATTVTVAPGRGRGENAAVAAVERTAAGTDASRDAASPPTARAESDGASAVAPSSSTTPPDEVPARAVVRSLRAPSDDAAGLGLLRATLARVEVEWDDEARPEAMRNPSAERRWGQLAPMLARAVRDVNDVLEPAGLSIGPAGEASWSFKNRGFGEFRRVRLEGASTAWLRHEVTTEGRLEVTLRMHDDVRSYLDDRALMDAADVTLTNAADVIAAVLVRLAEYAARSRPRRMLEAEEVKRVWDAHASDIAGAIETANRRLAVLKGRLEATGPPRFDPENRRYRLSLALTAGGVPYGSVAISCGTGDITSKLEPPVGVVPEFAAEATLAVGDVSAGGLGTQLVETTTPLLAHAMGEAAE
jgi:hypothetical protein